MVLIIIIFDPVISFACSLVLSMKLANTYCLDQMTVLTQYIAWHVYIHLFPSCIYIKPCYIIPFLYANAW